MIRNCVFKLPANSKENIMDIFNLQLILSNNRTKIFQNQEMRLCVDKKVARVILFDNNNVILLEKLRNYFYGEEYEKL